MFEILREFFLMMNLRKKILKKEALLGTGQEAGDDGVMKMWIQICIFNCPRNVIEP